MAKLTLIYEETKGDDGIDSIVSLQRDVYDITDLVYTFVDSTKAFGYDYVNQVVLKSDGKSWSNDW